MSGSISTASSPQVHGGHHHHHAKAALQSDAFGTDTTSSASATSGTATQPSTATPPTTGLQNFASELQSILLGAQANQTAGQAPTAGTGADGQTAAAATDPTVDAGQSASQGSPIRHLADRLQDLLGGAGASNPASASTTSGAQPNLQSVLSTLQQTLQQRLASYGSQAAAATTTLTA